MRLIGLTVILATVASALPHRERYANFKALPIDIGNADSTIYKLLFASAVWRHGDRSPERPIPGDGDAFTEDDWKFGGGGYGELSPTGMDQTYRAGVRIANRYMNQFNLLSPHYNSRQIYIQSTDYNRTLISAYSNLAGMYYGSGRPDQDYPSDVDEWPQGWIPIPVHTVLNKYDYVGNPDADCKRHSQMKDLLRSSTEYVDYKNQPQVKQTLDYLSEVTNSDVTFDNVYYLYDAMNCEDIHMVDLNGTGPNAQIDKWYPWYYTEDIPNIVADIVDKNQDFQNGLANPTGINGIDVSFELPMMRAGETIHRISDFLHGVLSCYRGSNGCVDYFKTLKYFGLSAHDKTVVSLMTLLGVKKYVIPMGWPEYAASALIELYVDNNYDEFFKVLYNYGNEDDGYKAITSFVQGCPITSQYCPLSVFDDLVKKYTPYPDMATVCDQDLPGFSSPTDSPSVTTTTPQGPQVSDDTSSTLSTTTTTQKTTTTDSTSSTSIIFPFILSLLYSFREL